MVAWAVPRELESRQMKVVLINSSEDWGIAERPMVLGKQQVRVQPLLEPEGRDQGSSSTSYICASWSETPGVPLTVSLSITNQRARGPTSDHPEPFIP